MNAFLTRRSRAEQSDHQRRQKYQDWLDKEQPLDYPRSKERDTGSPLPAILAIALVCAGIAAGLLLWGKP